MSRVFEIEDKSGRKVHLSRKQWGYIQKHPEMSGEIEKIKETLRKPDKVAQLKDDPKVHNYFRHYKHRKEYLLVSVKYLNGEGFIITSFYTDKIK